MVKAKMSYFWPKKGLVGPNLQKTRRMIENHMPTQHGLDTQCRP